MKTPYDVAIRKLAEITRPLKVCAEDNDCDACWREYCERKAKEETDDGLS